MSWVGFLRGKIQTQLVVVDFCRNQFVVCEQRLLGFGFQVQHSGTGGWNRFKNKTLGVSQPSVFPRRRSNSSWTLRISRSPMFQKSVCLGKYCRMSPSASSLMVQWRDGYLDMVSFVLGRLRAAHGNLSCRKGRMLPHTGLFLLWKVALQIRIRWPFCFLFKILFLFF